jgi:ArsR family transcriptional regulator, arsenate/arsenite/antimonite-responsive transcriptional repressor
VATHALAQVDDHHPVALFQRIFAVLLQGDSCNARLHKRLGLSPNLLSHHLSVLRQAGLITDQRDTVDARWIYYTVDGRH